jgi:hypothetical protein
MSWGRGAGGNRAVSPPALLSIRGDLSGADDEAFPEEGVTGGKHGFPHGREPKANDVHGAFVSAHFSNAFGSITTTRERISA